MPNFDEIAGAVLAGLCGAIRAIATVFIALFTLIALAIWAFPADAQQACPDRATVERMLQGEDYRETRQGGGVSNRGTLVELWWNTETGTWTVTETDPRGVTCLRAFGETWEAITEELPPPGDPT